MAIPLSSGFLLNAAIPLDVRTVVADITARNAIPAIQRYDGLSVYVISDQTTYQLKGGVLDANWAVSLLPANLIIVSGSISASSNGYYKTIPEGMAAAVALSAGGTIPTLVHVTSGTYTVTINLAADNVHYYFDKGTTVNFSGDGSFYNVVSTVVPTCVYGEGDFYSTSTTFQIYGAGCVGTSLAFVFECNTAISVNVSTIFFGTNATGNYGSIYIKGQSIISTIGHAIGIFVASVQKTRIDCNYISANAPNTYALFLYGNVYGGFLLDAVNVSAVNTYSVFTESLTAGAVFNMTYCKGMYFSWSNNMIVNSNSITNVYYYRSWEIYIKAAIITQVSLNSSSANVDALILAYYSNSGTATSSKLRGAVQELFVDIGSNVIAEKVNVFSITGGSVKIEQLQGDASSSYSSYITAGTLEITLGSYYRWIDIRGGKVLINGGDLISYYYTTNCPVPISISAGTLILKGRIINPNNNSINDYCIDYSGGLIVCAGAELMATFATAELIRANVAGLKLNVYASGLTVNRANILAAKAQSYNYAVTAVLQTSITLNDNINPPVTITVATAELGTYDTTLKIAQEMAVRINAAVLSLTGIAFAAIGHDDLQITADVAGTPFIPSALENMTLFIIGRYNSYLMTDDSGGQIVEDTTMV